MKRNILVNAELLIMYRGGFIFSFQIFVDLAKKCSFVAEIDKHITLEKWRFKLEINTDH